MRSIIEFTAGLLNVFEVFRCPDPCAAKWRAKAHAQRRCRRQLDDTDSRGIDGKRGVAIHALERIGRSVSQKMLTQTLRHMERDGLITNYDVAAEHSPR